MINMDTRTKNLFIALLSLIVLSAAAVFVRYVILQNYEIVPSEDTEQTETLADEESFEGVAP